MIHKFSDMYSDSRSRNNSNIVQNVKCDLSLEFYFIPDITWRARPNIISM